MTHMLKILSTVAVALLAVGALSAVSASAAEFRSDSTNTVTTSEQDASSGNQVFNAAGSTITCTEARFEATTTTKATTELTQSPKLTTSGNGIGYSGCTFFGVPVTVNMHTCDFVFHSSGLIDIAGCTTPGFISFKATVLGASCEVQVPNQTGLSKATYTNIGSGTTAEVTTDVSISGITYSQIGGLCGSHNVGTYTGKTTSTGEVDGTTTHTGVSFS